jgi:AraC-like DNA-binding protein
MLTASPARADDAPRGKARASERFMWLSPDRVLYVGLLGAPTVRTMGSVNLYVATEGAIRMRVAGGEWQVGPAAVVPPYVPHQVASEARLIHVLQVEAETVDLAALPAPLSACGVIDDATFVQRVRRGAQQLREQGRELDLAALDFDSLFFGRRLAPRCVDPRIQGVLDTIKRDPSATLAAEDCAQLVHLSFSRFLHLFKQDVGAPFRSFRTWKRARSLLHYVNRAANLAHVALDTGYPDSTHFSHSIRQVYGLKPKDIFAGSRRLAIYGEAPRSA